MVRIAITKAAYEGHRRPRCRLAASATRRQRRQWAKIPIYNLEG
jgi:hypothetical protein